MNSEKIISLAKRVGWNVEHQETNKRLVHFARCLLLYGPSYMHIEQAERTAPEELSARIVVLSVFNEVRHLMPPADAEAVQKFIMGDHPRAPHDGGEQHER